MKGGGVSKLIGLHSLKNRIVAGYMSVIIIFISLVSYSYFSVNRINDIHLLKEHSLKLQNSLVEIRSASIEFILNDPTNISFFETGNSIYIEKYNNAYSVFSSTLDSTIMISERFNHSTTQLQKLKSDIVFYNIKFNEVKSKIKERGFGKYGVVGEFEKAMIQLMQYDFGVDNVVLSNMQLYVKDYLLTGDTTTAKKLDEELYNFSLLLEKHISDNKVDAIADLLNNYSGTFNKLSEIDNQLGRNNNKAGLEKKLFLLLSEIDKNLEKESRIQEEFYKTHNKRIFRIYAIVILLSIALVLAISLYLPKIISKPINAIKDDIVKIGNGDLPDHVEVSDMREIGEMATALNNVIDGLKEKAIFADSIGNGKFDAVIKVVNENDVLTRSLICMRDNLKKVSEDDRQRNWITEGNAKFMEILRTNESNLNEISFLIISNLVKHLHVNQGGIFLINDHDEENPYLELTGCYAYDQRQSIKQKIILGEGLVGQCALEKQSIYITEIPSNYLWIASGLGNASPRCIFIAPLKINDRIYGVIELASFHMFEKYQMAFVESLSESIAVSVSTIKTNEKTNQLLKETQSTADSMKLKEDEMRENIEKMDAMKDELIRSNKELKELKAQMERIKQEEK